ncbi:MAG: hypothetical protein ACR2GN_04590 [Bacteroidia bacterium]
MIQSQLSAVKTETNTYISNLHFSIYIPQTKEGSGSFKNRNKLRYSMSLRRLEKQLFDKGISFVKVREVIKPLEYLMESSIWCRNCIGVAIFAKGQNVKVFASDKPVEQQEIIADTFFTVPLEKNQCSDFKKIAETLRLIDFKNKDYLLNYQ